MGPIISFKHAKRLLAFGFIFIIIFGTTTFAQEINPIFTEPENTDLSSNESLLENSEEIVLDDSIQIPEGDDLLSSEILIQPEESEEALSSEEIISIQETDSIVIEYGKKYEGDLNADNRSVSYRIPVSESGRFFLHDTGFDGNVLPKMDFEFEYTTFQDTYKDYKPSPGIRYMHLTIYSNSSDSYGHFSFIIDFASAKESFPCDQVNESKPHNINLDQLYYGQLGYGGTTYETAYSNVYQFTMPADGAVNVEVSQWEPKNNYGIKTQKYKFSYRIYQGINSTRWLFSSIDFKERAVLKKGTYYLRVSSADESMTGNYKIKLSTRSLPAPSYFTFTSSTENTYNNGTTIKFPLLYHFTYNDTTEVFQTINLYGVLHYPDNKVLYLGYSDSTDGPGYDKMAAKWKSSDKSIVTVDNAGTIEAVGYGKANIIVTALEDSTCKAIMPVDVKFSDVYDTSKYYYKPVCWAADHDYINGSYRAQTYEKPSAINFFPNRACTRLQFITILWKMAGTPAADKSVLKKFTDISEKDTGSSAVAWGVQKGIIFGYKDGTFKPAKSISRKEAMLMIYRAAGEPKISGRMQFKDVTYPKTSDSYKAILWGVQNKITNGKTADTFAPDEKCVRGQTATFLYRYKKLK